MTHIPSGNCVMQIQRQGEKEMCVTEAQDMGGAGIARHGVRDSDTSLRHRSIASQSRFLLSSGSHSKAIGVGM